MVSSGSPRYGSIHAFSVFTAPNLITFGRLLLVPVMVWLLLEARYAAALAVFVGAAASDVLDGYLARRFHQQSYVGAVLDPAADKLMVVSTAGTLTWLGLLPIWVAIAVVVRDVVIVLGFLAYRWLRGHVEMHPSWLGKANTGLVFGVFTLVLAEAAGLVDLGQWLLVAFLVLVGTIVASGLHYVWVWGAKAAHTARGHQGTSK
ncbi:MAG: CDP-alcohol phosphatidyltransferase family protein [Betaproteobacteria bacterium]|nr:CDP-alcohol phosphatidyltransferase family protein [Betaproteobacteria bacterium]